MCLVGVVTPDRSITFKQFDFVILNKKTRYLYNNPMVSTGVLKKNLLTSNNIFEDNISVLYNQVAVLFNPFGII